MDITGYVNVIVLVLIIVAAFRAMAILREVTRTLREVQFELRLIRSERGDGEKSRPDL